MKGHTRFTIAPMQVLAACGILAVAVALLTESDAVADGIRAGLSACANTLIPALFPFMALSGFLSLSDYGRILSLPLRPIMRHLFRIPGELGPIVFLSLIGGFPVGARSIATLLEQGRLERATAERMLCFCVNCGPSFLITAVGSRMLADRRAGMILFLTQTAATLLVGVIVSFGAERPSSRQRQPSGEKGSGVFVLAVSGACSALITMCAFAVLFSGVFSLLNQSGLPYWLAAKFGTDPAYVKAVISGLFEVTGGCMTAAQIPGIKGFLLISLIVSFGGLSVIFQIMSCFRGVEFRFAPYLFTRILHMVLAAAMAAPLYRKYCGTSAAWAPGAAPAPKTNPGTAVMAVCLIGMCVILLHSLYPENKAGKVFALKHIK